MSERGYPLPVKFLRRLAVVIARQRSSAIRTRTDDDAIRPPSKNWPQGFYKSHFELKKRRSEAWDWARHGRNIYEKVAQWFTVIGKSSTTLLLFRKMSTAWMRQVSY